MFYTNIDQIGNRLFHSYIDDKGTKKNEVIGDFDFELFVKARGNDIGLMGERLGKIDFSSVSDFQGWIRENDHQEIFGQTRATYQFISSKYREDIHFNFSKIKILIFDIETFFSTKFPTPETADEEIITISAKVYGSDEAFVFGTRDYTGNGNFTYVKCRDEVDLLKKFQKFWKETDPDIVTGYYIEGFDIPYLINRSTRVINKEFTNKFSPFSSHTQKAIKTKTNKESGDIEISILGITILDYLVLYKKYSGKTLESYRLDVVSKHELDEGKVDFSEYGNLMDLYNQNFDLFVEYNLKDTTIIERLEKKLNFILLVATVAYIGKCRYQDVFHQVIFWDCYIYNFLRDKGIQIPPNVIGEEEEIVGAFVKEPVPGLYSWLVTLDLTSLYPSIIMSWNLSPEKLHSPACHILDHIEDYIGMKIDTSSLKEKNVTQLANGAQFTRDSFGIFPQLTEGMFNSRKAFKKQMLEAEKELIALKQNKADQKLIEEKESEVSTFNAKQNAFKVCLNSLYGASANRYFRYTNRNISEGITMTGQLIIRFISDRLNKEMNRINKTTDIDYVIMSDTDSACLHFDPLIKKVFAEEQQKDTIKMVNWLDAFIKKFINPVLEREYNALAEYLNLYKNALSMKREIIADRGLWRGKKHYCLQVWDSEGVRYPEARLKVKGIEIVKSSTPQIVRDALKTGIGIVMNGTEQDVQQFISEFKKKFYNCSVSEISFPRGVNDMDKWIDKRGKLIKGVPIHTRGAILYNQLISIKKAFIIPKIKNGDKVKFVYLKEKNPTRSHVISFLVDIPEEFDLKQYVDWDLQFEKTFLEPIRSFCDLLNWSPIRKRSLSSLFD